MAELRNRTARALEEHRGTLLADWVEGQWADGRLRHGVIPRELLAAQSQEFLDLLVVATATGNLEDPSASAYGPLKKRMVEIFTQRMQEGMTRPESAFGFCSFKEFWIGVLHEEYHDEPSELSQEIGRVCRLIDTLTLVTGESAWRAIDERYSLMINTVKDYAIVMLDPAGRVMSWSAGGESIMGYTAEEIVGKHCARFYTPEAIEAGWPEQELQRAAREGRFEDESWRVRKDGSRFWANVIIVPLHDMEGGIQGFIKVTRDLTQQRKIEEQLQRQSREILELSTPVVQVWEGVVAAPLIGSLDSQRTQQFMERLLQRIVETNSPVALIDITGVPTIDTQTAQHLIETITAVKLVGAQVVLTGVRPAIAQTLVHLGVDLSGITTRSSLSAGLRVAMDALSLQVVGKNGSK